MLRTKHPLSAEVIFNFYSGLATSRILYTDVLTKGTSIKSSGIEAVIHRERFRLLLNKTEHSTLLQVATFTDSMNVCTFQSCLQEKNDGVVEDFTVVSPNGIEKDSTSFTVFTAMIAEVNRSLNGDEKITFPRYARDVVKIEEELLAVE